MRRHLFHGSKDIIERPRFGYGKPYNDYGLGFYCTEHKDMAKEWAVTRDRGGYANEYVLEMKGLTVVDLDSPSYTTLHWLSVLLENRWFDIRAALPNAARSYILENFPVDVSHADVIEGYRADDSYFMFAQDFLNGAISYKQLQAAMQLGDLGRQVVLVSKQAFSQLQFVQYEEAPQEIWLPLREQRDQAARAAYFSKERSRYIPGDLRITTIMDEGIGPTDARLR